MQYSQSSQILATFEPEFKRLTLDAISDPLLEEMAAYHLGWTNQNAGKRLRPLLLLAALQGLGADIKEGFSSAAAIELLHNATLVHDDIEDNGPSRHGQPALWKVYGQALALNFGDHLYSLALGQLTYAQPQLQLALLHAFLTAFNQVISGQHLDISQSALNAVPAYLEMVRLKTGWQVFSWGLVFRFRTMFWAFGVRKKSRASPAAATYWSARQVCRYCLGLNALRNVSASGIPGKPLTQNRFFKLKPRLKQPECLQNAGLWL